jgi:hypothetical protein
MTPRVSTQDLIDWVRTFDSDEPAADDVWRTYVVCLGVLYRFFGAEWVERRVFPTAKTDPVFLLGEDNSPQTHKHVYQVIALADYCFNLQGVDGFGGRVDDLGEAGTLEAALAELQAAQLIVKSGLAFRFRDETGIRGQDYDCEIRFGEGWIPCEMKCKVDSTTLTSSTLTSAVSVARRQLPPNAPSIVFIRIPELWIRNPLVRREVRSGLHKAFKNAGRIAAVVLHWEVWHFVSPVLRMRGVQYRFEINRSCRFDITEPRGILAAIRNVGLGGAWTPITAVIPRRD